MNSFFLWIDALWKEWDWVIKMGVWWDCFVHVVSVREN
jgi:hypothetical protein